MDETNQDISQPATAGPPKPAGRLRLPSSRASALLAAAMLGLGIAVGAAIGPAPAPSLAGNEAVAKKLPALLATLAARNASSPAAPAASAAAKPPAIKRRRSAAPAASGSSAASAAPAEATAPGSSAPSESQSSTPAPSSKSPSSALPPITSVWLIQLAGESFAEALANPSAASYIAGQLIPKGTLLSGWSALSGSAFADGAALADHQSALGSPPPLLHSIVQPPCPEGAAGAACAVGTPGGLAAADSFLKAALATITTTTTYSEHGLVVVTFATVGNATASELPAGTSTSTLTSKPPAGVVLLSPFAKAGARPSTAFNPASPAKSLKALLH